MQRKEKKNYVGSETPPTSIKEKEKLWSKVPYVYPHQDREGRETCLENPTTGCRGSKCPFEPSTQSQPSRHTYHSVAHLPQQLPHTAPLATQTNHIDTQSIKRYDSMTAPPARGHVLNTFPAAKSVQIIRPPAKLLPHPLCNIYLSLPLLTTQL